MQTAKSADGKITDLQVLRGISILLVLFHHISLTPNILAHSDVKFDVPFWLGVEIFFIISGYVVTLSLFKDGFNGPRFFIRRIFRLVPAMLLFMLFSFAVHAYVRRADLPLYAKELFTIPTGIFLKQELSILFGYFLLLDLPTGYMNGAMWSLSVEDQFYAAIAVLTLVIAVLTQQSERVARWCLLVVAAALYLTIGACRIGVLFGADLAPVLPTTLIYLLQWKFDFLALGIILAFLGGPLRDRFQSYFKHRGTFVAPFLLLIPMIVTPLCGSSWANLFTARALTGFGLPVAALCFGLLVLLAAGNQAFPATRGLLYRSMMYLGDRSYTLYLFHFPVMVITWVLTHHYFSWAFSGPIRYGISQAVLLAVLLLPLAEVVYRYVELPLMRLGKRLTHVAATGSETVVLTVPIGLSALPQKSRDAA